MGLLATAPTSANKKWEELTLGSALGKIVPGRRGGLLNLYDGP